MTDNLVNMPPRGTVLARAVFKAADSAGIDKDEIINIIGGWDMAPLFMRAVISLERMVGGNEVAVRHWFNSYNLDVGGVPAEVIKTPEGLQAVVLYLDAILNGGS